MKKNLSIAFLCVAIVSAVVGMLILCANLNYTYINETGVIVSFILIAASVGFGGVAALFYIDVQNNK